LAKAGEIAPRNSGRISANCAFRVGDECKMRPETAGYGLERMTRWSRSSCLQPPACGLCWLGPEGFANGLTPEGSASRRTGITCRGTER
jgi:hypothetical protein